MLFKSLRKDYEWYLGGIAMVAMVASYIYSVI